jgi:hypothetical protein
LRWLFLLSSSEKGLLTVFAPDEFRIHDTVYPWLRRYWAHEEKATMEERDPASRMTTISGPQSTNSLRRDYQQGEGGSAREMACTNSPPAKKE